ncbi:MAG: hypothetical protein PHU98_06225 [Mariniphaga sp.]|jgi:hypothetical protein|nr:hypothetical protein [Mariniphaga sp.]
MKELIKKHFESKKDDKFFKSSVQYYIESGNVSGSFFMTLKEMMIEYHKQQVKLLTTPAVGNSAEQYEASRVMCDICMHKWVAVRPVGTSNLECPNCHRVGGFDEII